METSSCCNSITGHQIATEFCTCHDSTAVVTCAKNCGSHFIISWMGVTWNFHHIWIVVEKSLVKWAPAPLRATTPNQCWTSSQWDSLETPCQSNFSRNSNSFVKKCIWKVSSAKLRPLCSGFNSHYSDVIMSAMVSQITGVYINCTTICSGPDQRKHQSSASLDFVRGIHLWTVDSPHKWPVTGEMFPFDDVIMSKCLLVRRVSSTDPACPPTAASTWILAKFGES